MTLANRFLRHFKALFFGIITLLAAITPGKAQAQEGLPHPPAYFEFLTGFISTFDELAALLLIGVTSVLVGLWQQKRLRETLPILVLGILLGTFLSATNWIPPFLPAFCATVVIGLIAAASPKINVPVMYAMIVTVGVMMMNTMFSGFPWRIISLAAYLGAATAFILGYSAIYTCVRLSQKYLPYDWVPIAWRAGASWLVAIAVLMTAFIMTYAE